MKYIHLTLLFFAALPSVAMSQAGSLLPDGEYIPRAIGDQREPRLTAKLLAVTEGASRFGSLIEGEAGIGKTFPVYLFSGSADGDYVVLAVGAGIWGRFNMETAKKHLISSDWNFRVPLVVRRGATRLAISYNHVSSHLGDDYIDRFNEFTNNYSVDNFRFLWFQTVGRGVEIYGGGAAAMNITPSSFDRLVGQFGVQVAEFPVGNSKTGFLGLDFVMDQNAGWDPRLSLRTGMTFLPEKTNRVSLIFEFLTGPSPQGQFLNTHETFISLGLNVGY